jgi:FixJ family two-component response regulator
MTVESRWNIVLVDDDDSLRRALTRMLRLAGHEVQAFRNAEESMAAAPSWAHTCLVLDVDLPGIDGVAYRRALSAAGCEPPTIFITALDGDEMSERLREAAVVLHKPFRNDELLLAIDRLRHS